MMARPWRPLVLVPLVASALSVIPARARCDIALQVVPGIERYARASAAVPVCVRVTGTYRRADARLEVVSKGQFGTRLVAKPVHLSGARIDELHTIVTALPDDPGSETIVRLVAEGQTIARRKVEGVLTMDGTRPAIVALTADQSGLVAIASRDLRYGHRGEQQEPDRYGYSRGYPQPTSAGVVHSPYLIYPRPSALPDAPRAYDAIDVVVLGDLPLDALTDRQWEAIVGWTRGGGTLVVSGGADLPRLKRKGLAELLPMKPDSVRTVASLAGLHGAYGSAPAPGATPLAMGPLRPGAVRLAGSREVPLVLARGVGQGYVFLTTFDLFTPDLKAWPGQTRLWRQVLSYAAGEIRLRESLMAAAPDRLAGGQNAYYGYYGTQSLVDALAGSEATAAPGVTFIGLFLLLYIVLLVPLNYLLLRKWDKKELAWITAPLIIAVFTAGAYALGYSAKGAAIHLRFAGIVEGSANSRQYSSYTLTTIFSPAQRRYDLRVADPDALVGESAEGWGSMRTASDLAVRHDGETLVEGALVSMWDYRTFNIDGSADLGGAIAASTDRTERESIVTMTNRTQRHLRGCRLVGPGTISEVGDFAPGATHVVRMSSVGGEWPPDAQWGLSSAGAGSGPQPISQALVQTFSSMTTSSAGNIPVLLVGWVSDPVAPATIDGASPHVEGTQLAVIHLPPPAGRLTLVRPKDTKAPARSAGVSANAPMMGMSPLPAAAEDAQTLNAQAYAEANAGKLDDAVKTAKRAFAKNPKAAYIADTVGEMYQRKGDYKSAAVYFRKALNLPGGQATTETHAKYGETLLKLGKKAEAVRQLTIAAGNPADPWGAQARTTLDRISRSTKP